MFARPKNENQLLIHSQKQSLYQAFEPFYTNHGEYDQDLFNIITAAIDELPLPLPLEAFGAVLVLGSAFSRFYEASEAEWEKRAAR